MLELYKNIKKYRELRGMSQDDLAKKTGYSDRTSISKIEAGKVDLSQSKIVQFADALGVAVSDLWEWNNDYSKSILSLHAVDTKSFPLLGNVAAGEPIFASEEKTMYVVTNTVKHADFVLQVQGDSMINARIYDGDYVFVKKQNDVESGEIAVVLIDDEATLKRVYKGSSTISLVAENPKYAPIIINRTDHKEVRILGKAIAFQSNIK